TCPALCALSFLYKSNANRIKMLKVTRSIRSFMCTWIALVLLLFPLLAHAAEEEEAAKGRGGGGGRGSNRNGNGGKKPPKTVKLGSWNAPLWAVVLVPKPIITPYVPPHIIIYELPPATPSYPTNKIYDKPAVGGEAQKYYSEPYGQGGMGYNTASGGGGGYGYNNPAPSTMHTNMASGGGGGYGYNNSGLSSTPASPPQHAQNLSSGYSGRFMAHLMRSSDLSDLIHFGEDEIEHIAPEKFDLPKERQVKVTWAI
ncbi:7993_t:CDS:2, partial [Acaulospora colombiana]